MRKRWSDTGFGRAAILIAVALLAVPVAGSYHGHDGEESLQPCAVCALAGTTAVTTPPVATSFQSVDVGPAWVPSNGPAVSLPAPPSGSRGPPACC